RGAQELFALAVEGQERLQRQVAPAAIEPVEERQLLGAMGGIVGDVEIEGDATHLTAATPVTSEHRLEQRLAHRQQLAAGDVVLEARQRRLRGQRVAGHRIAAEQQLVHGIVGEPRRVVGVLVAERQAVDALAEQIRQRMAHLAALPLIEERARESRDQTEPAVGGLEQHGATVGTGVGDLEGRGQRPVEKLREPPTRCRGRVTHVEGLRPWENAAEQALSTTRRSSRWLRFVNNPGYPLATSWLPLPRPDLAFRVHSSPIKCEGAAEWILRGGSRLARV